MTEQNDTPTGMIDIHDLAPLPKFRSAYNHGSIRVVQEFAKPSMTKQEFKDQCDINKIVANFMRTGDASLLQKAHGAFLDLTPLPVSYQDALNLTIEAREAFDLLPAAVRAEYGNDVQSFLLACNENPDAVFGQLQPPVAPSDDPPATTPPSEPKGSPEPSPAPLQEPKT